MEIVLRNTQQRFRFAARVLNAVLEEASAVVHVRLKRDYLELMLHYNARFEPEVRIAGRDFDRRAVLNTDNLN